MYQTEKKEKAAYEALKGRFGWGNPMQSPRLLKVVVSVGVGSAKDKKRIFEVVPDRLAKITGQRPAPRPARQSIASFKIRAGEPVGFQATLRGKRMRGFVEKLFMVALPRARDFRGIPRRSIDEVGNLTIGLKEHTVFPEASDEELRDVFGMSITFVTSAKNKEEAQAFFEEMGVPFSK
ncbi:MAG: 50S ribosomal protein L5 [Candidatus Taylorbacteria bacterium]|nr:50S ribosomal protein L5 [Candidatus Taylorbacteria bacterium]